MAIPTDFVLDVVGAGDGRSSIEHLRQHAGGGDGKHSALWEVPAFDDFKATGGVRELGTPAHHVGGKNNGGGAGFDQWAAPPGALTPMVERNYGGASSRGKLDKLFLQQQPDTENVCGPMDFVDAAILGDQSEARVRSGLDRVRRIVGEKARSIDREFLAVVIHKQGQCQSTGGF